MSKAKKALIAAVFLAVLGAGAAFTWTRLHPAPKPVTQPVAFNHKAHLDRGMTCADCHRGAMRGPHATIPGVGTLGDEWEDDVPHYFSHQKHLDKELELECSACHTKAEQGEEAGMPVSLKKCMMCHETVDETRPEGRKLADLLGEKPQWSRITKIPDEIRFSHKTHVDKEVSCTQCHTGIPTSTSITRDQVRVTMATCVSCHTEKKVSTDCATCHTDLRKDAAITCMHCHAKPIGTNPEEAKLRDYAKKHERIPWVQVNKLPGHVYFSHAAHVSRARMDCAECHGDMKNLTTPVTTPQIGRFTMDRCMECHQEKGVSNDCLRCHK